MGWSIFNFQFSIINSQSVRENPRPARGLAARGLVNSQIPSVRRLLSVVFFNAPSHHRTIAPFMFSAINVTPPSAWAGQLSIKQRQAGGAGPLVSCSTTKCQSSTWLAFVLSEQTTDNRLRTVKPHNRPPSIRLNCSNC